MQPIHVWNEYRDRMTGNQRDTVIQIVLSIALGIVAFLAFCILRPRWTGLYAARKKQKEEGLALPELPDTLFGWMPVIWRITDQQVLASAGLDAYVFLRFFKMAIKFLVVTLFFALVVIKPVHDQFPDKTPNLHKNGTTNDTTPYPHHDYGRLNVVEALKDKDKKQEYSTDYLWMYLVFTYLFTGFAGYLIVSETRRVIDVRQEYLGTQTTITDRTIKLSGIPKELRSEQKIKEFVEELEIGSVESVTLCRNWKELDELMIERNTMLRKLEEAWTVYLGFRRVERNLETLPITQPSPPNPGGNDDEDADENADGVEERTAFLREQNGQQHIRPYARERPLTRVWYGRWFRFRSRKVDAIDYFEEKLHNLDEKIKALRKEEFKPTPVAFVTMESVATCQMAVQALLDPSPMQLIANLSPAPSDVVWQNTYMPRRKRMFRSWSITVIIGLLTVIWSFILIPVATALNADSIHKILPKAADWLNEHPNVRSVVNTQVPTLIASLLNVAVPYFYDWLANMQGMISQGDVELSVISKNFFFTFFNFFIVFTALGTAANFYQVLERFGDALRDSTTFANLLAQSLQALLNFYTNFIILQGLGLYPFRLLEFGSVALYPVYMMGAKTPRDYAELVQPPVFSYGFYLPTTMLIFIICIVYSVLRDSWKVLLAGLAYFILGHFCHKYQLLYAMDHRQHSTGRGWLMMCYRFLVGLVVFQLTTAGQLALKGAVTRSVLLIPLFVGTLWFSYVYSQTYGPLMKFIALRSIRRSEHSGMRQALQQQNDGLDPVAIRYANETDHGQTVDESRETGLRFINPSLIAPLQDVWIADKGVREEYNGQNADRYRDADGVGDEEEGNGGIGEINPWT